nr:unnamed protein product [Digitaria exilis]
MQTQTHPIVPLVPVGSAVIVSSGQGHLEAANRDGAGMYGVDGRQIETRAPACSASSVRAGEQFGLDGGWTPRCCCARAEAGNDARSSR